MVEFIEVSAPQFWPSRCATCTSAAGPMADTHMEIPDYGRVYVCESCARRLARLFGYAPGERMDELAGASAAVTEMGRERDRLVEELEQERQQHGRTTAELADERERTEALEGRVAQLEARIVEQAESNLALAGRKEAA